ncbi:hypothetical protein [uncultured Lactobacillus sp.]|uniref:hypothetical protein n=1 Tax=uncultured Lactobacillus sp. TaxID=153152 RepID=UPI00280618D0|nr:hypothetical protein [uncultured Lactobacillus sp.]
MKKIDFKKVVLALFALVLGLTIAVKFTSSKVNAESTALKGNYLYDRDGVAHKVPITKKGNHTQAAERVAALIAKCVGKRAGDTDLKRVDMAAYYVFLFSSRDSYSMKAPYYNKAYGVFINGKCSCAGSADAMQMVLKKMGFKAKHVNKNKFTHQWCTLKMDGKKGYADGQAGFANYGGYLSKKNNFVMMPENSIIMKKFNDEM